MSRKIAAAYIRVSTEDQTEYSPDAQLRELRDYAEAHQITLDDRYIYSDEGLSGRKASRRPGFLAMIHTAKRKDHPFDLILVHKFDRFARSREDSVVYKSILRRCGVEVISVKEPIAEGNYSGVMEAIYESFAEAYSINLAQEVKKGMTEKALRGQLQTCPPFGYFILEHKLIPKQEEAEWIRYLFYHFSQGEGFRSLSKTLNEAGVRTHRGNCFEARTVEYILRNPVYIGFLRWDPTGKAGRSEGSSARIISRADHPPLIEQQVWDQVQAKLKQRIHADFKRIPDSARKHWLSGILRCGKCGATLIWTKPGYFRCANYLKGSCTSSQHIRADLPEYTLCQILTCHLSSTPLPCYRILPVNRGELPVLESQLEQVKKKQKRLEAGYLNGIIDPIRASQLQVQIRARITDLENRIRDLSLHCIAEGELTINEEVKQIRCSLNLSKTPIELLYAAMQTVAESLTLSKADASIIIVYRFKTSYASVTDRPKDSYSIRSSDPSALEDSGSPHQIAENARSPADAETL